MTIAAEVEPLLLEQAFFEAGPLLEPWFGEALLRENLAAIGCDLSAAGRSEGMRLIELCDGAETVEGWALVQYGEITEPAPTAVVRVRSFAIHAEADARRLARAVREALGAEACQRVLVFVHGERPAWARVAQTHYVAGMIHELRQSAANSGGALCLFEPESLDFYDEYASWYEEFWRRRPHLKDIWIEPRGVLEHCLEQGGLRLVSLEGELCGLLAAERRVEFGLSGWRIRERVTTPAMWGRGVSTAAIVPFAQSLAHDERTAIWGTIVPENESSLASALRVGRRIVGSLYEVN